MEQKLRRQKDIITNAGASYVAATETYQDYIEGSSQIFITYFQIADEASRTDTSLENTHEVVGSQSSLFYYQIKNVPVRGTSALDIVTQLTQRGLESFITGDFVLTPNVGLTPRSGEFFAFEDENFPELGTHLFMITDVQYDRATSQKFYRCSYKLYPSDTDMIYSHVVKRFVYDPEGSGNDLGVGNSAWVTEEDYALSSEISATADALVDKMVELFYNAGMDTFTYQRALDYGGTEFDYFWSPYVCHFIYKNSVMEKANKDFLQEIYVQDINETEYPAIYSELGYRGSIFRAVEVKDPNVMSTNATFMEQSVYDLNRPLNLPFFSSAEKYHLLDVDHKFNVDFWFGAFNWIYDDENHKYKDIDGNYKFTGSLPEYLIEKGVIDENGDVIEGGGSSIVLENSNFYKKESESAMYPIDIFHIYEDGHVGKAMAKDLFGGDEVLPDALMEIVRQYFRGTLVLDEETIKFLNDYYYENNIRNYILLPLVIYILQNQGK